MGNDNQKELTIQERCRKEKFENLCRHMNEKGYKEVHLTISALKANLVASVTMIPLIIILYLIFRTLYGKQDLLSVVENFVFLLSVLIAVVIHELIHGLVWSLYCKNKWKSINLGFVLKALTPYCTCNECLPYRAYSLGIAMPTIVLGIFPYILSLITGNYEIMIFSLFLILGGGGDIYILWLIRRYKKAVFIDHPYLVGCVAFV